MSADLTWAHHGSVTTITPKTDSGRAWLIDHVDTEGWQWFGPSLVVDTRFAPEILRGAAEGQWTGASGRLSGRTIYRDGPRLDGGRRCPGGASGTRQ